MNFVNLHVHSHFSLLDGLSKPKDIINRVVELGQNSCALVDHGGVNGAIQFIKEAKKQNIKPILGAEFYYALNGSIKKDSMVAHQVILAKNSQGWYKLVQLVSQSNLPEHFYYKPRIDLEMLQQLQPDGDLISFSGHPGSTLDTTNEPENYLNTMKELFGKENFFIECQRVYGNDIPSSIITADRMRFLAKKTNTQVVATGDAHYCRKEDTYLQRLLLCSQLKTTFNEIKEKQRRGDKVALEGFFDTDCLHIPSLEEMTKCGHTEEEIRNTELIESMCEEYDLTSRPQLPKFECPTGEEEYLKSLCQNGIIEKGLNKEYTDRLQMELNVILGAKLAGYFLIVQDYVNWAKSKGWLVGCGRGSSSGCLMSYLLGITTIDPLKYNLIFERFYNSGRNTSYRVSLPDIDVDFPVCKREEVISYIKRKYGSDRVSQIATFGKLQGRGAIKEVLRVNSAASSEEMNQITKNIPQEYEIADQLQDSGEESVLQWILENNPKRLKDYCTIKDGKLDGPYAQYFETAIRLEGTYKTQGIHPAGVVISDKSISEVCPIIRSKDGNSVIGFDMESIEEVGMTKFDILGTSVLSKLMTVNSFLSKGKVVEKY